MGDLSKRFSRWEFACHDKCGQDTVDTKLIDILEAVRAHFDQPVHVNSGNRCAKYNRKVGGSTRSQHLLSRAADIRVENVPAKLVYNFLTMRFPNRYGFGLYVRDRFVHVDSRPGKARWRG